jgi:hypothetical protein
MRLMIAVLEDAVDCIGRPGARASQHRRLFEDALAWVRSDSTQQLFAFECICDVLGLDAAYLRRGLSVAVRPPRGRAAVTHAPAHEGVRTWSAGLSRLLQRFQQQSHAR